MRRLFFADEAGNLDFARKPGASKCFILVTVSMDDCAAGHALLDLRRELAWEGIGLTREFHASEQEQVIRNRVFAAIEPYGFRIDATILEKSKTQAHVRDSESGSTKWPGIYT